MNKNVKTALAAAGVLAVLALAFWYGGSAPGLQGWSPAPGSSNGEASAAPVEQPVESGDPAASAQEAPEQTEPAPQPDISKPTSSVSAQEDPAPAQSQPAPEPESPAEEMALTCTLSIRCDTILDNWDWLDPDKAELIPADGVILAPEEVSFQEGETVFDLLQRRTRAHGIHMEATFTPGYGSSYVEGIANLYEFDCGQQSGWVYLVNGVSPGYSSSQYDLSHGDVVEWVYTCDLGQDVGGTP